MKKILETARFTIVVFTKEFFHLIKFNETNRKVDNKHSEKLGNLIEENGLNDLTRIIKVGKEWHIVDGQHRARYLMKKDNKLYCFLCKGDFSKTYISQNLSAKKLALKDIIEHFAKNNNKNYETLLSVWDKADGIEKDSKKKNVIQKCILNWLYADTKKRQDAKKLIEDGKFKVKNKRKADLLVKQIYECQSAGLDTKRWTNESLINMIKMMGSVYDHEHFIKQINKASKNGKIEFPNKENVEHELINIYEGQHKVLRIAA